MLTNDITESLLSTTTEFESLIIPDDGNKHHNPVKKSLIQQEKVNKINSAEKKENKIFRLAKDITNYISSKFSKKNSPEHERDILLLAFFKYDLKNDINFWLVEKYAIMLEEATGWKKINKYGGDAFRYHYNRLIWWYFVNVEGPPNVNPNEILRKYLKESASAVSQEVFYKIYNLFENDLEKFRKNYEIASENKKKIAKAINFKYRNQLEDFDRKLSSRANEIVDAVINFDKLFKNQR